MNKPSEQYCKDNPVNDFIEFKTNQFLVSILEADYFAIVERPESTGFFGGSGKVTKIRSINRGYMSMGMSLLPGPP